MRIKCCWGSCCWWIQNAEDSPEPELSIPSQAGSNQPQPVSPLPEPPPVGEEGEKTPYVTFGAADFVEANVMALPPSREEPLRPIPFSPRGIEPQILHLDLPSNDSMRPIRLPVSQTWTVLDSEERRAFSSKKDSKATWFFINQRRSE